MVEKRLPWEEIIQHYKKKPQMEPMVEFIKNVRSLTPMLFGTTFLDDLILSVHEHINLFMNCMHVKFDGIQNSFVVLYYHEGDSRKPEWKKVFEVDEMNKNFRDIVRMAKWY